MEIENVGFVTNDVAVVDAEYFGGRPTPIGHATYVVVKQAGRWLIRAVRVTRYPEAPPPASVQE